MHHTQQLFSLFRYFSLRAALSSSPLALISALSNYLWQFALCALLAPISCTNFKLGLQVASRHHNTDAPPHAFICTPLLHCTLAAHHTPKVRLHLSNINFTEVMKMCFCSFHLSDDIIVIKKSNLHLFISCHY